MDDNDEFGNRMKLLEQMEARRAMPLLPCLARLDGKGFSRYTKRLDRPFDKRFSDIMIEVTRYLVEETCARIGYTQSDEISLVYYSDNYESQIFFDGKIQKMISVLASMATAYFNQLALLGLPTWDKDGKLIEVGKICLPRPLAHFDCRVWTVPNKIEAANAILWRECDCYKNAISMAARHYYSHNELMDKTGSEMQELLLQKKVNFNDYPPFFKRGTFIRRSVNKRILTPDELSKIPEKYRKEVEGKEIERTDVAVLEMPPFNKVANRVDVIFDGAEPQVLQEQVV